MLTLLSYELKTSIRKFMFIPRIKVSRRKLIKENKKNSGDVNTQEINKISLKTTSHDCIRQESRTMPPQRETGKISRSYKTSSWVKPTVNLSSSLFHFVFRHLYTLKCFCIPCLKEIFPTLAKKALKRGAKEDIYTEG